MRVHRLVSATALVWVLASDLGVLAQGSEVVALQNGAVFEGLVVLETSHFLDIQMANGRIRLFKRWIRERVDPDTQLLPDSVQTTQKRVDPKTPEPAPFARRSLFPDALRDGANHLLPLQNLHRFGPRLSSSEEVALSFCSLFQKGRGGDVLETLANPMAILEHAFPNASRGLTSYSRRLAARLFLRVLLATCARNDIEAFLGHARLVARTTTGPAGMEEIEIAFNLGQEEPLLTRIGVREGRIVDVSHGPPPLPQVIQQIKDALKVQGRSWALVPLLEEVVESEITRSLPGGQGEEDPVAQASLEVWSLRPKERRYVLTLPWAWEPAAEAKTPGYADFLLHTQDGRCAAMAVTEVGGLSLADLEKAFLDQLPRTLGRHVVSDRREVQVQQTRGLRLRIDSKDLDVPLTYEVLLLTMQSRVCQFVAWSPTEDVDETRPLLEGVFSGLRFLN